MGGAIDFSGINRASLAAMPLLLDRLLPGGQFRHNEYVALNPTRADRHLGSFSINIRTGAWGDFATGDRGGDVISFVAYINRLKQSEAARHLTQMLGLQHA